MAAAAASTALLFCVYCQALCLSHQMTLLLDTRAVCVLQRHWHFLPAAQQRCFSGIGSWQHPPLSGEPEKSCVSAVQALFPPDKTANFFMDITLEDADGAKIQE